MDIYINRTSKYLGSDNKGTYYFEALEDNNSRKKLAIGLSKIKDKTINYVINGVYKRDVFDLGSLNNKITGDFHYYYDYKLLPLPIIGINELENNAFLTGTSFDIYWAINCRFENKDIYEDVIWTDMSLNEITEYCSSLKDKDKNWSNYKITATLSSGEKHSAYLKRKKLKDQLIFVFFTKIDFSKINTIEITQMNIHSRKMRQITIEKKIDTAENIHKKLAESKKSTSN